MILKGDKMKFLITVPALILFSSLASAGTLTCAGEGLSISEWHPDGGPFRVPTIQVVLNGDKLVDEGMGRPNTRSVVYSFDGGATQLQKPVKNGNFVITYFKQDLTVSDANNAKNPAGFQGEVVCRQTTYVGVPIP
jgi:hypothetical protein